MERPIVADAAHTVTETVDIAGPLPNAIWTLLPSTILAILQAGDAPPGSYTLCRKFFRVATASRDATAIKDTGTTVQWVGSRVFARGNNRTASCGVVNDRSWISRPHWVRLPPVQRLHCGAGSWLAWTTHGLYCWGCNANGQLAVSGDVLLPPTRHPIQAMSEPHIYPNHIIFRPAPEEGWVGVGHCGETLGQGHTGAVQTPATIPLSGGVTRWTSYEESTFGWTKDGLLATGANTFGQLGLGHRRPTDSLTAVPLPAGVRGGVRVVQGSGVTFIGSSDMWYGVGRNHVGQLIVPPRPRSNFITARLDWTPVPHPVRRLVSSGWTTVVLTPDGRVMAAGKSGSPSPLDLPRGASEIRVGGYGLFVRCSRTWFSTGVNQRGQLGVGARGYVRAWRPVLARGVTDILTNEWFASFAFCGDDGMKWAGYPGNRSRPTESITSGYMGRLLEIPGIDLSLDTTSSDNRRP